MDNFDFWFLGGVTVLVGGVWLLYRRNANSQKGNANQQEKNAMEAPQENVLCNVCSQEYAGKDMMNESEIHEAFREASIPGEIMYEWLKAELGEMPGSNVCKSCFYEKFFPLRRKLYHAAKIECYPDSSEETVNVKDSSSVELATGEIYDSRERAKRALQYRAALHGKNVITQIEYTQQTQTDDDYTQKRLWSCRGIAAEVV